MAETEKKLGVIILNWNGLPLLKRFLSAAVRYTVCDDVDLIVADNGSTDGSVEWVGRHFPEVKVLAFEKNSGFSEGYNRAISECAYPYVTLLNSDVELTPGWWRPVIAFMEDNPDVGAVQPKIKSWKDKGRFEYAGAAGGYLDALGYPFCRGRLFEVTEEDNGQYDGDPIDCTWASGACMTVRRDVYISLGGLDPLFFAHMEEIDLCCRMLNAGYRVCALTDSEVYHVGGASLNQGSPQKTYLNFRNNLLLLHKNLPESEGKRILVLRRLADTLAFFMFLLKGDVANARAILKAHGDFRKMKGNYRVFPDINIFKSRPDHKVNAVWQHYVMRKKKIEL